MKLFTKFSATVLFICFFLNASVSAVPAYPYPIKVKQPDGNEITILLKGDEFFNYTTTEDGYVILEDKNGFYNYAKISTDNTIISSDIKVSGYSLKNGATGLIKASSSEFIQKIQQPSLQRVLEKKINSTSNRQPNSLRSSAAVSGNLKGLVILANFSDVKFTIDNPTEAFKDMLNKENYNDYEGKGSARDYFIENSNGTFTPEFNVFGPVELPREMAYYGADIVTSEGAIIDPNVRQMIIDACEAAKQTHSSELNFADYDHNNDGIVDNVFIFYAGANQAEGGGNNPIWSLIHTLYSKTDPVIIDGVTLTDYACTSELKLIDGASIGISGIGTFIHEFGHVLGLPDLYDTDGELNGLGVAGGTGIGYWCTMSYGGYLNKGRTPPYYGAIERWILGWIDLYRLTPADNKQTIELHPISSSRRKAYVLETPTSLEFFSFESRKKEGWDEYLPSDGMLVYHIDYTPALNKTIVYNGEQTTVSAQYLWHIGYTNVIGDHPCMKLLQANNNQANDITSAKGHPFPQPDNTSLSDTSIPGLLSWTNEKSGAEITNITKNETTGIVSFDLKKTTSSINTNQMNPLPFTINKNNIVFNNISGNSFVKLFDASGRKQASRTISGSETLTVQSSGFYIIKIKDINKESSYKILIK
jgi:M6 family metalloprotease-like protein